MNVHNYPFPIASQSYFKATNKAEQKNLFLEGIINEPSFSYYAHLTKEVIDHRLALTRDDLVAQRVLTLVKTSFELQSNEMKNTEFRSMQQNMYVTPSKEYVEAILHKIAQRVTPDTQHLWVEVKSKVGQFNESAAVTPSKNIFQIYHQYLLKYLSLPPLQRNAAVALESVMQAVHLDQAGWTVQQLKGHDSAKTHHKSKTFSVGEDYVPRTSFAANRIAVHEVIGHGLRGAGFSLAESEGFAIVLEQLTRNIFSFRRSYRYLAVALGWGALGTPMTFREVFEILWRLMVIAGAYKEQKAKNHAFDECYRAFRGGRADVPGAVFLKDTVYFSANVMMWKRLGSTILSYNEFVDVIEGRRTIL